mgnify:CR=1 FL=1
MAISFFNIKKWFKMLTGNSVYHVKQDELMAKCDFLSILIIFKIIFDKLILSNSEEIRIPLDSSTSSEVPPTSVAIN